MFKNTKLNKTYNFILRFIIISASYGFIAYQLIFNDNYKKSLSRFTEQNTLVFSLLFVFILLLLMLLNWSIEAYKWRYLIRKVEDISFLKAYKAILAGLSVSTLTPNRAGEFLGRVFILRKTNPWKAIFISILCNMSQLMITIILGSISLSIYILRFIIDQHIFYAAFLYIIIIVLLLINLMLLAVFFNVSFISRWLNRFVKPRWRRIKGYLKVFSYFRFYELRNVLLLSLSRYFVFSLQFYMLMRFFGIPLHFIEALFLITIIYYIITAIPSIALAEIGIRGSVAVGVIDYYMNTSMNMNVNFNFEIIASTSVLWIINIALPAFIGNFFVLDLKFFKEKV